MPPVGFEPTISAGERLQTYALDRAATGTGNFCLIPYKNSVSSPERTHYTSITKVDQIMQFRKIIAVYYDNQRNINYTLWGKCVDS